MIIAALNKPLGSTPAAATRKDSLLPNYNTVEMSVWFVNVAHPSRNDEKILFDVPSRCAVRLMIAASQTAGVAVILKVRDISFMGVVLLLMVLLLLAMVWTASKMADAKTRLARQLSGRADAWYIATGTVRGRFHVSGFLPCTSADWQNQSFAVHRNTQEYCPPQHVGIIRWLASFVLYVEQRVEYVFR